MNIQIFGTNKGFDTKKAERYFKERRIKYQFIDISRYPMSAGEFKSVLSVLGFDGLFNGDERGAEDVKYLAGAEARAQKLFENQYLLRQPIVRNGKKATAGYCPDVWKDWE